MTKGEKIARALEPNVWARWDDEKRKYRHLLEPVINDSLRTANRILAVIEADES